MKRSARVSGWNDEVVAIDLNLINADNVESISVNQCAFAVSTIDNGLKILYNPFVNCFYRSFLDEYLDNVAPDLSNKTIKRNHKRRISKLSESFLIDARMSSDMTAKIISNINVLRFIDQRIHYLYLPFAVQSICCGDCYFLVLSSCGRLFSCGDGVNGELGLGGSVTHSEDLRSVWECKEQPIVCVSAGNHHSCFITRPHGHLYTFGCGCYGRLGLSPGQDNNVFLPTIVESLMCVGELLSSGLTRGLSQVSCGQWHTIALSAGLNDLYGWGWNKFGQLGSIFSVEGEIIAVPERLTLLDDDEDFVVTDLLCGSNFTVIRGEGGKLFSVGAKDDLCSQANAYFDNLCPYTHAAMYSWGMALI